MAKSNNSRRLDLHEALSKRSFQNAVICCFTFDPLFFENYCLEKFATLSSNNNISVITDQLTYLKIASAAETECPKQLNLRYLLHPVTVEGRFHSKLFMLTNGTAGRLIVGSANFTRAGITTNAEVADVFDFDEEHSHEFLPLFKDALQFVAQLAGQWPSESLASNLDELQRTTPWLDLETDPSAGHVRLIHNLDHSLWSQLLSFQVGPVENIHVVSRFYDGRPDLIDRVMSDWNPKKLFLYTQNGITTMTPEWLTHPCVRSGRAEILLCTYEDKGYMQPLHAKAIVFESASGSTLTYGSANFTSPALLSSKGKGNVETMMVVPRLRQSDLNPRSFCDPSSSALRLTSQDQLRFTMTERQERGKPPLIDLHEVILDEDRLLMKAVLPASVDIASISGRLQTSEQRHESVPVVQVSDGALMCRVPERLLARLQQAATVMGIQDISTSALISNQVFITYLIDIKTQDSVRGSRRFREATQSVGKFFGVLNDLVSAGDERALLTFLNFCDIPLMNIPRSTAVRPRAPWPGQNGMRFLGARNLKICKSLHEATLLFCDRHLKKLKKHTQSLSIEGMSNFLQIFLSMGGLLQMQIERATIALEETPGRVSVQEWADCRMLWDAYFARFRELMQCLWDDYLSHLKSHYSQQEIQAEAGQDLEDLHGLCDEIFQYRMRIEEVRIAKCKGFSYFYSVLGSDNWKRYVNEVQQRLRSVNAAVLGQ